MTHTSESNEYDQLVQRLDYPSAQDRDFLTHGGDRALAALIRGLEASNAKIRVWCLKLIDHMADAWEGACSLTTTSAIINALSDTVPRVRSQAIHALLCDGCHTRVADQDVVGLILPLACFDPSVQVRRTAMRHLPADERVIAIVGPQRTHETDAIVVRSIDNLLRRASSSPRGSTTAAV